jgi:uncharacterized membrane protein
MSEEKKSENSDRPDGAAGAKERDTTLIKPSRSSVLTNLRNNFFAGIVVTAPIGITAAIVYWFLTGPMSRLDAFVKRAIPDGGSNLETILRAFPFLGVIVAIVVIILIGAFAKNFIGRAFLKAGEELLEALPVVRSLYRFFKNVFETALQQSARSFKEVALVEYPRPGFWAIAFVVGDAKGEISHTLSDVSERMVSVFVPTVPNPTSGFLLFVPRAAMRPLSMTVEDAAKTVFSIGLVTPEFHDPADAIKKLEALAAAAASPKRKVFRISVPRRKKTSQNG